MKIFRCDRCDQIVYFENTHCLNCQAMLGFCPDNNELSAFEAAGENLWKNLSMKTKGRLYRACQHYVYEKACNWMIPANSTNAFCASCDLNQVIPDLGNLEFKNYWKLIEASKRRLLYTLIKLKLPIVSRRLDAQRGLGFRFLAGDTLNPLEQAPVLTGHDKGLITINIAEANDAMREKFRLDLNERYRTLLGHFRHEIGHYYWYLWIHESNHLKDFRGIFGDESVDYAQNLNKYYESKSAYEQWSIDYISEYARSHPWEDWAETWAHYLHMVDTLETADSWGLALQSYKEFQQKSQSTQNYSNLEEKTFSNMLERWVWVTCAMNSLNRSMGMSDFYPFILSDGVVRKLRFVHHIIQSHTPQSSEQ